MRGFTLVEVLIASFIIMVGVSGFATLHSSYVQSDAQINLRQVAMQLAQEKFDDLRQFDVIATNAGQLAFDDIANNAGGQLASGEVEIMIGADNEAYTFNRTWTAQDIYFVDSNNDGEKDSWLTAQAITDMGLVLPARPAQKQIAVTIEWESAERSTRTVIIEGSLAPVPVGHSFHAFSESPNLKVSPQVPLALSANSADLALELTGEVNVATSEPEFESVGPGDNQVVTFSNIRYTGDGTNAVKQQEEQFLTVSCRCRLAGTGHGYTPTITDVNNGELTVKPGSMVVKDIGEPVDNNQPEQCEVCCRDHHDTLAMIESENHFRAESGLPHSHYDYLGNGQFSMASYAGDPYIEACRFKLVDGYFALYPDWQLVDAMALSDDYLNDKTRLSNYQDYIENRIASFINNLPSPAKPTDRNIDVSPGGYQIIARGLYIDPMSSSHFAEVKARLAAKRADWLALVPFYEVSLTALAEWSSDNEQIALVTNESLPTGTESFPRSLGGHSRGRLTALSPGQANVAVSSLSYNAGITGSAPVSPAEYSQAIVDNSLVIAVDGQGPHHSLGLSGDVFCTITRLGVTHRCETRNPAHADYIDLKAVEIAISPEQFSCTIEVPGAVTAFYSCSGIPYGWQGNIRFDVSYPGYQVEVSLLLADDSILKTNTLTIPGELTSSSSQQYNLIIELAL